MLIQHPHATHFAPSLLRHTNNSPQFSFNSLVLLRSNRLRLVLTKKKYPFLMQEPYNAEFGHDLYGTGVRDNSHYCVENFHC